jgi:predicted MFS family arabinose efflux permease
VVSAYAFSAGSAGIVLAGFADRFDRRKLLLFFYAGFMLGTLFCGLAPTYELLLAARIVTGLFGGVIGSTGFAIVADLFPLQVRGRVAGWIQTSFAAAQVLGLPLGLSLANRWGWHAPFLMIVALGIPAGVAIALGLKPLTGHLAAKGAQKNPFAHLKRAATRPRYITGFTATMLLSTGGFMLMPFGSTFLVQNLQIPLDDLPLLYTITGASSILAGPLAGRASDAYGKFTLFVFGTLLMVPVVLRYTSLTEASFGLIATLNVVLFIGISSRMASSMALTSALPDPPDRGAYMAISSSLQQLSGGVAAWLAGQIVHQAAPTAPLEGYPTLGVVAAGVGLLTLGLMFRVNRLVSAPALPTMKQA